MGSGYFANAYIMSIADGSADLEALGLDGLISVFSEEQGWEDYQTDDRKKAERVAEMCKAANPHYESIDVFPGKAAGTWRVAFFK